MIEEFEQALCDGRDLEQVAQGLVNRADCERHERLREIQHDLDFCKLIQAGLTEESSSGPYMISRAYVRMYRRKHYPGGACKLAAELMRDVDNEKGEENDDNDKEK